MRRQYFETILEKIYATFGKRLPTENVCDAIFERIKDFPDDFLDYAYRRFQDMPQLPQNLGYCLRRELWPEYLEKNPDLRAGRSYETCPKCIKCMPGYRKAYAPDYSPVIVRCTCGNAPNPNHEPIPTDAELTAKGFYIKRPYCYRNDDLPLKWRRAIECSDEPRKAHQEYMEKHEGFYGNF